MCYAHARLGTCTRRIAARSFDVQAIKPERQTIRPRCLVHALPDTRLTRIKPLGL